MVLAKVHVSASTNARRSGGSVMRASYAAGRTSPQHGAAGEREPLDQVGPLDLARPAT